MQPATARPFVSRRPAQSSPPPELEAESTTEPPRFDEPPGPPLTPHHNPTAYSAHASVMLSYLRQSGRKNHVGTIMTFIESGSDLREPEGFPKGLFDDLLSPCWRFLAGYGAYFGPVPVVRLGREPEGYAMTLGSIWLDPQAQCSAYQHEDVAGAWEGWDAEERQVYTDVRAASLWVCREWFAASGHDADECCGSLEIRLMCARYASNAVERFRQWRREVLGGRKGGAK